MTICHIQKAKKLIFQNYYRLIPYSDLLLTSIAKIFSEVIRMFQVIIMASTPELPQPTLPTHPSRGTAPTPATTHRLYLPQYHPQCQQQPLKRLGSDEDDGRLFGRSSSILALIQDVIKPIQNLHISRYFL